MRTFAFVAFMGVLSLGLVACCCSSVAEEETGEVSPLAGVDGAEETPSVTPAGWESPFLTAGRSTSTGQVSTAPAGGGKTEWNEYKNANLRLRQQVESLSREVDSLVAQRTAPPPAAMPAAPSAAPLAAAPAVEAPAGVSVEGVRAVLASVGASEIRVALNAQNEVYLTIPGTTFPSGKAALKPAAAGVLQRAVGALQSEYPGMRLRVEGHTDSQPIRKSKWGTNQKLSEARASTVRDHIVSSTGLDASAVESRGFGSTRPVASNKTAADMALNRRCELVLIR